MASLGKIPNKRVWCLITTPAKCTSHRDIHAVEQDGAHGFFHWGRRIWRKATTSSRASSMRTAPLVKPSARELAKSSLRASFSAASYWSSTERSAAVTMPSWAMPSEKASLMRTRCSKILAQLTRQRWQPLLCSIRRIALVRPLWASLITSLTS